MRKIVLACILLLALHPAVHAQTIIHKDPVIEKLAAEVNADSLRSYILKLVSFGTRSTLSSTTHPTRGIGASREWVVAKFREFAAQSNGRMTVHLDRWTLQPDRRRIDTPIDMGNPMAWLKGSDPNDNRIFVISGHLDSRASDVMNRTIDAPGANDDGSGVAAVMECARILSRQSFPATILFVALSGEEQGLFGAEHLADSARKSNWNIEAVLNNDIMGSNNSSETNIIDNTRVRVFSEGLPFFELDKKATSIRNLGQENDGNARQLARYVKEIGERYVAHLEVVMVYRNDRFLRGGDHTAFVQKGFTAVRITEMNEQFEHQHQDVRKEKGIQYGDLPEFMDFEYLRKNTALNLACLANLAKSPGMPQDVKIEVRGLSNSTSLSWKAPAAGKPQGYYVLVRETYQPFWQKKFFTTQTSLRLPYSKDHYFFAVQSVSQDGNESLPVIPTPGR
ncbi:MAG TPA: M20/M25/M40 family metallo-hydrolase [Chitinophagaceae bacterium]|nr:M20/M25/M40 family metallo-hydrolase [Chitinophagaceae bacterium]